MTLLDVAKAFGYVSSDTVQFLDDVHQLLTLEGELSNFVSGHANMVDVGSADVTGGDPRTIAVA